MDNGAIVNLDLSSVTNQANNDLISVPNGNLLANGPVTVTFNFLPLPALNQPYTIFSAASIDGAFLANLVAGPTDYPATFAEVGGTTITVTFSSGPQSQDVWQGDGITNTWALGLAGQWTNGLGPCLFKTSDEVLFNDSTPNYTVNIQGTNLPGSVTVNAAGNYTFQGNGAIGGLTTLTKSGAGTVFLNSTNTYTGGTILNPNSGFVVANTTSTNGFANTLGSGACAIGAGSSLQLNDNNTASGATTYIGNGFTGAGRLLVNFAAGTSARNTYITNAMALAGSIELTNAGSTADKWTITPIGSYGASLIIDNGSQLFDGAAGTLAFPQISVIGTGNSETRGAIRLSAATTVLNAPLALLGSTTIGFEIAGATISGTITNATSAAITLTDGTANSSGAGTFAGTIGNGTAGGTLGFAKTGSGTAILAVANTFTGPSTTSGGVVQLNNANSLQNSFVTVNVSSGLQFNTGIGTVTLGGLAGTGNVAVQDLGANPINPLIIGNNNSGSGTLSGVLSGPAGSYLLMVGTGVETFSGINTFAGMLEVSNGIVALTTNGAFNTILVDATGTLGASATNSATINVNGTLAAGGIGSFGTLVLTNTLSLSNNSTLMFDLGATTAAGSGSNDLVLLNGVNGNLSINGQVNVAVNALGGVPVLNQPYTLIQFAGSLIGNGGGFQLADTYYQGYFTTNIGTPSTITFTFTGTPVNTNLVWQGNGVNNFWSPGILGWTNLAGTGMLDYYDNPDNVTFNDTATNFTVNLVGTLYPGSVTVNASNNYAFAGTGTLGGSTGMLKDGPGTLTVNNANIFTGPATVQGGTLVTANAAALGAVTSPLIITNDGAGLNGTLEVDGQNLGLKPVIVSGPGVGGAGAIVNNLGAAQIQAVESVTMTGNTTFGGTNRWDIRNPNYTYVTNNAYLLGAYNLVKTGLNQVSFVGIMIDPNLGNVDVRQGLISYEQATTGLGNPANTLSVENGASFQFYNATNQLNKNIVLNGGLIRDYAGNATNLGPVTLNAGNWTNTFDCLAALTLMGPVGGNGGFTKIDGSTLILTASNNWTGPVTISSGTLQVDTNGTSGFIPPVLVTNNGNITFQRSDATASFSGTISGTGSVINNGSGTLTLTTANTYVGGTTLTLGSTTVLGANNALGSGPLTMGDINGNVATLNLNNGSQTVSNLLFKNDSINTNWVNIPAGNLLLVSNGIAGNAVTVGGFGTSVSTVVTQMVSIAGAGGLAVGAPNGTFSIEMSGTGGTNVGVFDLSRLANFTANVSTFNAGTVGTSGGANLPFQQSVLLAQTNNLTATNLVLSTAGTGFAFSPNGNAFYLGQNSTLNVSNLFVGGGRNTLRMAFENLVNPALTLDGLAGLGTRANLKVGDNVDYGGGSSPAVGTLDLSGGTVTAMLDSVTLGYGGNGVSATLRATATGSLILGNSANSVNVNNLTLGWAANYTGVTSTNFTSSGSLVMSNGTLTVNNALVLGRNDETNGTYAQTESGAFTLYGGSVSAPGLILGMHTLTPPLADTSYATGLVAVVGGTLSVSSDITNGIGDTYGSLTVAGGSLNLNGNKLGSAARALDAVSFQSGTVQNLGELNNGGQLTKTAAGTLTLAGVNTYSGSTVVSNGTLLVNGSIAGGAVTAAVGTLGGSGSVNGPVSINSGATLAPGTNGGISTLTINNSFSNAGNLLFKLNKALAPQSNDVVVVTGALASVGSGTLTVSNLGPALAVGDTFFLFNTALPGGNNLVIVPPTNGVTFLNNLASNGSIQVLTVPVTMATNPTNITFTVSGSTMTLTWPGDHLGWYAQSNSVGLASPAMWFDVPNSQLGTNLIINLNPGQTNVFYRLSSTP